MRFLPFGIFAETLRFDYNKDNRGGGRLMKAKKIKLCYTEEETAVLLRSLINLKNNLIRQGRYADIVDEVILRLVDAKIKRIRV